MTGEKFKEVVGIAVGRASMCWTEIPTGVFDSSAASEQVDKILAEYDALLEQANKLAEALNRYATLDVRTIVWDNPKGGFLLLNEPAKSALADFEKFKGEA